ncbi:MAG: hypothetical protein HY952_05145 [Elusimicrobia bacterium]|nr:hypothetical protein [Elusimicrobiota bacterium]
MILLILASLATILYLAVWMRLNLELKLPVSTIRLALFFLVLVPVSLLAFHRRLPRETLLVVDYSIFLLCFYIICLGLLAALKDLFALVFQRPRQNRRVVAYFMIAAAMLPALQLTFKIEPKPHPSARHIPSAIRSGVATSPMVKPLSACVDIFAPECGLYASRMFIGATILKTTAEHPERLYMGRYRASQSLKVRLENICHVDISDRKVTVLDGPSSRPIFSPDEKVMVYDKYDGNEAAFYGNGPRPQVDVWIMDVDGKNKRQLTTGGRTKALRWLNEHEILAAKVEFEWGDDEDVSDWTTWRKTGYLRIDRLNGVITELSSEPPEAKSARSITPELVPGPREYSGRYDFKYGAVTVFSTPYVCTYSEWTWKPEVLRLNKDQFLTVAFSPYPGKEAPFSRDDGDFNLVRVDIRTRKHELLREKIDCCPNMTTSPNGELLFLKLPGDRLLLANKDFTKSREIGKAPEMTGYLSSSSWSADSQFLFLEFYYPEVIYQIGVL